VSTAGSRFPSALGVPIKLVEGEFNRQVREFFDSAASYDATAIATRKRGKSGRALKPLKVSASTPGCFPAERRPVNQFLSRISCFCGIR
jgi:hypothetical protein